jgi:hypothetical protein
MVVDAALPVDAAAGGSSHGVLIEHARCRIEDDIATI